MTSKRESYEDKGGYDGLFYPQEELMSKDIVEPGCECRVFQAEHAGRVLALFNYLDSDRNEIQDVEECYIDKKMREYHIEYMREVLLSRGWSVTWVKKDKKTKSKPRSKYRILDYKIGSFYIVEEIEETADGKMEIMRQFPLFTLKDARDFISLLKEYY